MKTLLFSLFLLAITCSSSVCQITLTAGKFADVGMDVNYVVNSGFLFVDNSGEDQIWDMSSFTGQNVNLTYVSPNSTPFGSDYPNANLVELNSGNNTFLLKTDSAVTSVASVNAQAVTTFLNDLDLFRFPMDYGDSFEDDFIAETTILATNDVILEQGLASREYDAFGQLYLPFDTIDVIRIYSQVENQQILNGDTTDLTNDVYQWFSPEFNSLVASYARIDLGFQQIQTWSFLNEESFNSLQEISAEFNLTVHPNPTMDVLNVESDKAFTRVQILNQEGRIVIEDRSFSSYSKEIDLSALPVGMYQLLVSNRAGVHSHKIIKN